MMTISLDIDDELTGKHYTICLSYDSANKLYKALNELFGDSQFGAKAGELITMEKARIKLQ